MSITREANGSLRVTPLGDNLVVRCLSEAEQVACDLPHDLAGTEPCHDLAERVLGRVLSVGDGRMTSSGQLAAPSVQEGDRVLFPRWAGIELLIEAQPLVVLAEGDILAVLP